MIGFDKVMEFTRVVSSHAAFEDAECRLFYRVLVQLPPRSTILEVGVEYGRSTSIILQVAKEAGHRVMLIDPFVDQVSGPKFMAMAVEVGYPFTLFTMTTAGWLTDGLAIPLCGLIHIDGSHTAEDLITDCKYLLRQVAIGGYACFHDYGRDSLPEVMPTVDKFVRNDAWVEVGHVGTLLVMRRVA